LHIKSCKIDELRPGESPGNPDNTDAEYRDEEHATMATRFRPIIVHEPEHLQITPTEL